MPNRTGHGGSCCGIEHFYNWGGDPASVLRHLDSNNHASRIATEVVLTHLQTNPQVFDRMEELGYRRVYQFRNPNSGNTCHVFYHPPNGQEHPDMAPPPPAPLPPVVEPPQLRWTLKRVRIAEGLVGERTVVHQFPATQVTRPVERTIRRHIEASWDGGNYPRRVYEVVQEELQL